MSNIVVLKKAITDPKQLAQFKYALPEHITAEKFQRVAITAINNNPDIANCTPESVMNGLMKCAQDGLLPDGRESALVKFGNTAQYMPMAYGLIKRMRNSGEISTVNAHVVYEQDEFEFVLGDEEKIHHKPKLVGERGKPILVYAIARLKDGGIHREILTIAEVEKIRSISKSKDGPAWKGHFDEMAKKTAIHRLAKRVPTASDIEKLIQRDTRIMLHDTDDEPETKKTSLVDSINEAIDLESEEVKPAKISHDYDKGDPEPQTILDAG